MCFSLLLFHGVEQESQGSNRVIFCKPVIVQSNPNFITIDFFIIIIQIEKFISISM